MIRRAFRMAVAAGQTAEYERRHNPIWEELRDTLVRRGVHTYSIFLDPDTGDLCAYVELESEERWAHVAATDVGQRWRRYMRDVLITHPDSARIARDLREVFHLESTRR